MRRLIIFLSTAGFSGYSPFAPGTAGSVVGIAVWILLFDPMWRHSPALCLAVFAVVFAVSCWIANEAEKIFGQHDCSKIVIDEVLGMVFTMVGNPSSVAALAIGFVVFRVADVIKPWPAAAIDRGMRNGAGVMLDDLAAAVYANIALHAITHFI
jgi:phosphatidylglycerophosphatase A